MKAIIRKRVLKTGIAVVGLSTLAVAVSAHAQQTLNIVSWGGAYSMSQHEAYDKPWMEKTGDEIVNIDRSGNALAGPGRHASRRCHDRLCRRAYRAA